jgi:hypothetical protein
MDRRSNVSDPSTAGFSGHSRFSGARSGAPPRRLVPAALALGPSTARLAPRVSTALPPVVSGGEAEVRAGRVERDAELARVAADLGDEEPALDAGHGGGRECGGVGVFAELASGLHAGQVVAQVRFPAFEAGGDRWKPRTPPSARRGRRHLSYDSCPRAHRTAPLPPWEHPVRHRLEPGVRRRYTSWRTAVSGLRRRRVRARSLRAQARTGYADPASLSQMND